MTFTKVRVAINEMAGNMAIDRETALNKLERVRQYVEQLIDTLGDDDTREAA